MNKSKKLKQNLEEIDEFIDIDKFEQLPDSIISHNRPEKLQSLDFSMLIIFTSKFSTTKKAEKDLKDSLLKFNCLFAIG